MKTTLFLTAAMAAAAAFGGESTVRKQAGIGFRYDDNKPLKMWQEMTAVFDKYDYPLMFAVNYGRGGGFDQATLDFLHAAVQKGHELMDHTPIHSAFRFEVDDPEKYAGLPWVDHVKGRTVCCKYILRKDLPEKEAATPFKVTLEKNRVYLPPEVIRRFLPEGNLMHYNGKAYIVHPDRKDKTVFYAQTFWCEPVDFGSVKDADAAVGSKRYGFYAPPEVLDALAKIVAERTDAMKLPRPKTWIQPGGYEAILQADNVRDGYAKHGYICAATYQDSAYKVFCESEPQRCAYAMMWGQLHLEDNIPMAKLKTQIADAYARHQVLFASSHMQTRKLKGGWEEFLQKHDELLAWCKASGIPVRTQSQWAKLLYYSKTDPAENIFPAWTVDLDKNGRPDGYSAIARNFKITPAGELVIPSQGPAFAIRNLGGLEKGVNTLHFTVKEGQISGRIICSKGRKKLGTPLQITGAVTEFTVPAEADWVDIEVANAGNSPLVLSNAILNQSNK